MVSGYTGNNAQGFDRPLVIEAWKVGRINKGHNALTGQHDQLGTPDSHKEDTWVFVKHTGSR